MQYPGGKNSGGAFQRIINLIPPHRLYVEPFLGSGAVLRHKRPAQESLGIDLCPGALAELRELVPPATTLLRADAVRWIESRRVRRWAIADAFWYLDPPYLADVCRSRLRYRHVLTFEQHARLLDLICGLSCMVMISGYSSHLYNGRLAGWHTATYEAVTRGRTIATEWLWMNYPPPTALHDYRYLGSTFREREKVRRQQRRWAAKLARMDTLQRQALLAAIAEDRSTSCSPEPAMEYSSCRRLQHRHE